MALLSPPRPSVAALIWIQGSCSYAAPQSVLLSNLPSITGLVGSRVALDRFGRPFKMTEVTISSEKWVLDADLERQKEQQTLKVGCLAWFACNACQSYCRFQQLQP